MKCQYVIRIHPIIQETPHYEVSMGYSCTPYHSLNPTLWSGSRWVMYTLSFSEPHTMKCQWVIRVHPIIQQTPHYEVSMGDSCTPYHSANLTLYSVNGWFMYTLLFSKPHIMKCQWVIHVHPVIQQTLHYVVWMGDHVHPIIQQTPHYEVSMGDSCTPCYSANPTLCSVNGWFMYTLLFSKPHTM